jgi:hypothetical protein
MQKDNGTDAVLESEYRQTQRLFPQTVLTGWAL